MVLTGLIGLACRVSVNAIISGHFDKTTHMVGFNACYTVKGIRHFEFYFQILHSVLCSFFELLLHFTLEDKTKCCPPPLDVSQWKAD